MVPECDGYRLPTDQEWEWIARHSQPDSSECIQSLGDGPYAACVSPVQRGFGLTGFTSNSAELVWGGIASATRDAVPNQVIRGALGAIAAEDPLDEVLLTRISWRANRADDSIGFRLVRSLPNPAFDELPTATLVWSEHDGEYTTTVVRPEERDAQLDGLFVAGESGLWRWATRTVNVTLTDQRCYEEHVESGDLSECESDEEFEDGALIPIGPDAASIGVIGLRGHPHPRSEEWSSWETYAPHEDPIWSIPGAVAAQTGGWFDGGGAHGWGTRTHLLSILPTEPLRGLKPTSRRQNQSVWKSSASTNVCFARGERDEYEDNAGGSLDSVRFQVDCGARSQGDERVRVVGSFRRGSSYVNNCSRDTDFQEANIVLETDELPEFLQTHWPPPPEVVRAICANQRTGTQIEHFGWTHWTGSAHELADLLEDYR